MTCAAWSSATSTTAASFESFLVQYDLDDPALTDIGRIIHEADIGDDLYDAPEAPGLDRLIRGVSLITLDDHQLLAVTQPLYDGLYELFRRSHLHEESDGFDSCTAPLGEIEHG